MFAVFERRILVAHEAQPSLVEQLGGLNGLSGAFARHLDRGQAAQFVVNEDKQLLGGVRVARFDGGENQRSIVHVLRPGAGGAWLMGSERSNRNCLPSRDRLMRSASWRGFHGRDR